MKFIQDLREGSSVSDIYLCRRKLSLVTKNGKAYESLTLQDKTGSIDAKIWDPGSAGIEEFDELDYVDIVGDVTVFQGKFQLNVKRARKCREGEYDPKNYLPVSERNVDEMYAELLQLAGSVKNGSLHRLLELFFVKDKEFIAAFRFSSAAKAVHHGYVGGLLEHTLGVAKLCNYLASAYPVLNRDLLLSAAILHDIGKVRELSPFPRNDYTDDGQLIGHIVMGVEMIDEKLREIPEFPPLLALELRHCILAHHGELEFGSPKKPAIVEAAALNFADNTDAKMEIFKELLQRPSEQDWLGFQNVVDSNVRRTFSTT